MKLNNPLHIINLYYVEEYDNLCKKIGRRVDQQDVEDVVQEAFTKAMEYFHTYKGDEKGLPNWFGVILANVVRDHQQEVRNNKAGLSHTDNEEFDEDNFPTRDADVDTDWVAIEKVEREIASKTRNIRTILELYFLHSYPPDDIRFLVEGYTKHSVKSVIHRFKQEMREKYG